MIDVYNQNVPITPKQIDRMKLIHRLAAIELMKSKLNNLIETYGPEEEIPTGWPVYREPTDEEHNEYLELLVRNEQRTQMPKRIRILEKDITDKEVEDAAGVGKKKKRKIIKRTKSKRAVRSHKKRQFPRRKTRRGRK